MANALSSSLAPGLRNRLVCLPLFLLLGLLAGGSSWAREGVDVGKNSAFSQLVPADSVERSSLEQYAQMLEQAAEKKALASKDHPQLRRLRDIANKIIPHALSWNPRAANWQWEVNLIGSKQINAFCMPGGKIAFFTGILDQLALTDDEAAMVMGHEIAHALREHAREQAGKNTLTKIGAVGLSIATGGKYDGLVQTGANLLSLKYSRNDETDADLVGLDIAARAGYDPEKAPGFWERFAKIGGSRPPEFLSTHPADATRIRQLRGWMAEAKAQRPKG